MPEDIAILLRAMTGVSHYLRALQERNIPFVADGGSGFADRYEVLQLKALLRVLANPADAVALVTVLRGPLAGIPDRALHAYARDHGPAGWSWRMEPDRKRHPLVSTALERLRDLAGRIGGGAPIDTISAALRETTLPESLASADEGAQRVANLERLATLAASLASEGVYSLEETLEELDQLLVEGLGESALADEGLQAVRVLTIHKAKGLEFPIVFVPDLGRRVSHDRERRKLWAPVRLPGASGRPPFGLRLGDSVSAWEAIRGFEQKDHEEAETRRILYVAMTRARERLILVNSERSSKKGNVGLLSRLGLRRGGRPAGRTGRVPCWLCPRGLGGVPVDPTSARGTRRRTLGAGGPSLQRALGMRRGERGALLGVPEQGARRGRRRRGRGRAPRPRGAGDEIDGRSALARSVGTGIHLAMEGWGGREGEELVARAVGFASEEARRAGADTAQAAAEAEQVARTFLASELGERWRSAEILGREIPFLLPDGDRQWRGKIDLLYRLDGAVHVADFKTDRLDSGAKSRSVEETAREQARAYEGQLSAYAGAVVAGMGTAEPPRCEVWFLREGLRVVL